MLFSSCTYLFHIYYKLMTIIERKYLSSDDRRNKVFTGFRNLIDTHWYEVV